MSVRPAELSTSPASEQRRLSARRSDRWFLGLFAALGGSYVVLILAMLVADLSFTSVADLREALASKCTACR